MMLLFSLTNPVGVWGDSNNKGENCSLELYFKFRLQEEQTLLRDKLVTQ